MYPSVQLRLIAKWLRDRSSVSIFDLIDAGATVLQFINNQFRTSGEDESSFMSAPARTLTEKQLADALDKAASEGESCGFAAFAAPGLMPTAGAMDWKSILKTLVPLLLSLFS